MGVGAGVGMGVGPPPGWGIQGSLLDEAPDMASQARTLACVLAWALARVLVCAQACVRFVPIRRRAQNYNNEKQNKHRQQQAATTSTTTTLHINRST
jgi:hypothetical protein